MTHAQLLISIESATTLQPIDINTPVGSCAYGLFRPAAHTHIRRSAVRRPPAVLSPNPRQRGKYSGRLLRAAGQLCTWLDVAPGGRRPPLLPPARQGSTAYIGAFAMTLRLHHASGLVPLFAIARRPSFERFRFRSASLRFSPPFTTLPFRCCQARFAVVPAYICRPPFAASTAATLDWDLTILVSLACTSRRVSLRRPMPVETDLHP